MKWTAALAIAGALLWELSGLDWSYSPEWYGLNIGTRHAAVYLHNLNEWFAFGVRWSERTNYRIVVSIER